MAIVQWALILVGGFLLVVTGLLLVTTMAATGEIVSLTGTTSGALWLVVKIGLVGGLFVAAGLALRWARGRKK